MTKKNTNTTTNTIKKKFLKKTITKKNKSIPKYQSITISKLKLKITPTNIKKTKPPKINYLTNKLYHQLTKSIQNYQLTKKIPSKLKILKNITKKKLTQYFHSNITIIKINYKQLHFIL